MHYCERGRIEKLSPWEMSLLLINYSHYYSNLQINVDSHLTQEHDNEENSKNKLLARFLMFSSPKFRDEPDDRKAETWIGEMEEILRMFNSSEKQ